MRSLIYLVVFMFLIYFVDSRSRLFLKVSKLTCDLSMSKNITDGFCKLKAYNRSTATISFEINIHKNLTKLRAKYTYYFKFLTEYRKLDMLSNEQLDMCPYLSHTYKYSPVEEFYYKRDKIILGNYMHACPYYGKIQVKDFNFGIDSELPIMFAFASGEYYLAIEFYDQDDIQLFYAKAYFALKSNVDKW